MCSRQQLTACLQVKRLDLPLPNTGYMYKNKRLKGQRGRHKDSLAGTAPEKSQTPQREDGTSNGTTPALADRPMSGSLLGRVGRPAEQVQHHISALLRNPIHAVLRARLLASHSGAQK